MSHAKERFSFTKHLVSATLLQGDLFQQHNSRFPDSALQTTVEASPSLDKARLKTELSLIYENEELRSWSGVLALYQALMANNLQDTFTETVSLLNIHPHHHTNDIIRIGEVLFYFKQDKNFPKKHYGTRSAQCFGYALLREKLTQDLPDFNTRVIEKFATQKDRRAKFLYK